MNNAKQSDPNDRPVRSSQSSSPLGESRMSARTAACVALSVLVHSSLIVGMMLAPQKFPEAMKSLGGASGADKTQEELLGSNPDPGVVSMVEVVETTSKEQTPQVPAVVESSPTDVVVPAPVAVKPIVPKPAPAKKVATKPVEEKKVPNTQTSLPVKTVKTKTIQTVQQDEKSPVVVSTPLKSEMKSQNTDESESNSESKPQANSEDSSEDARTAPVAEAVSDSSNDSANEDEAPPVILAEAPVQASSDDNEKQPDVKQTPAVAPVVSAAAVSTKAMSDDTSANGGPVVDSAVGSAVGSATGGPTSGEPIRNASELRALGGNPQPVYPARDRLARRQGTALIIGKVTTDGRVADVKLERSSGSQQMDSASMQAFKGWRFQAGQEGWVRQPFQFRLVGDAQEVPSQLGKPLRK